MENKKILVTGGTGFIGSHLVETLLSQGRSVTVLVLPKSREKIEDDNLRIIRNKGVKIVYGDLRDYSSLLPAIRGVETVFHLGGISRPMNISPQEYHDHNVLGTKNILEAASKQHIKKFIHVSTVSVLGISPNGKPLKETDFEIESADYGITKLKGETLALHYHSNGRLSVVVIRPSLVYGPRCEVRKVIFKFVKLGLFPLFNNGKAKMEFCYMENLIQALLLAESNHKAVGEVFNITDGQSYTIKQITSAIATELGVKPPSIHLPTKLGVALGYLSEIGSSLIGTYPPFSSSAADWMSSDKNVYDCSKAKSILGYKPKVSLSQGISETVSWYKIKKLL